MLAMEMEAPDFEGIDQESKPFRLSSLRGSWVILYFYPKDETTGCTKEACAVRDESEQFRGLGAEVVGVSVQDQESHRQFALHHGLGFRLIADTDKRITQTYDALGMFGVAKRVTYLIDPSGRIRSSYRSEVAPVSHVKHAMALLRAHR